MLFQPHRDRDLHKPWNLTQLGVLILPLLPTFGAIAIGLALLLAWKRRYSQILNRPIIRGLLGVAGLFVLTACFAENPADAFLGLGNFIPYFGLFAGLAVLIRTPAQLQWLSWLLTIPAIPVVILGLGQQFFGWSGIEALRGILGWVLEAGGSPPDRMSSVFMYANILAAYLVIVFTLASGLLIQELGRVGNSETPEILAVPRTVRLAAVGTATLAAGVGLLVTNSRNAWLVAVCVSLSYAVYLGWNWLLGIVGVVVAAVLGAAFAPSPVREGLRVAVPAYFWQRLTDQNFDRPVETLRITQWKFAGDLTRERPITGWGLRNFTPLYEAEMGVWMGHPHNLLLMMLAEVGIPATLAFFAWVGWVLAVGVRCLSRGKIGGWERLIFFSYLVAFGACILFNLADVTIFDLRVNALGWLLLAAIYGVAEGNGEWGVGSGKSDV